MAGWQSIEAGHFHAAGDSAIECLLCKGPADMAMPISEAASTLLSVAGNPQTWERALNLAIPCIHHPARGPPHYS
jgi:hypothetical protein